MRGNLAWHSNMEAYIGWHTPVPGFGSALCELLNFGVSTEKVWEPRCFNSFPHTQHDHPAAWAQIHIQNMTTLSTSEVLLPKSNRPTRVFEHLRTFDSKTQSFSQRVLLNDLLRLCGSTSVFCNRCERARYVKRCVLFRPKNLTICLFNSALCPIRWWHQTLDFLGTQRFLRCCVGSELRNLVWQGEHDRQRLSLSEPPFVLSHRGYRSWHKLPLPHSTGLIPR